METGRIIDVWQVITQEPRVAREEALLLLQTELQQKQVKARVARDERRDRKHVVRTHTTNQQHSIDASKQKIAYDVKNVSEHVTAQQKQKIRRSGMRQHQADGSRIDIIA